MKGTVHFACLAILLSFLFSAVSAAEGSDPETYKPTVIYPERPAVPKAPQPTIPVVRTVTFAGVVYESGTNRPIAGALVNVSGGGFNGSATTNNGGGYTVSGCPSDSGLSVSCNRAGYRGFSAPISSVGGTSYFTYNIIMTNLIAGTSGSDQIYQVQPAAYPAEGGGGGGTEMEYAPGINPAVFTERAPAVEENKEEEGEPELGQIRHALGLGDFTDAASDFGGWVRDRAEDAAGWMGDRAEDAGNLWGDIVGGFFDWYGDRVSDGAGFLGDLWDGATGFLGDIRDGITGGGGDEEARQARDEANQARHEAEDAQRAAERARDDAERAAQRAERERAQAQREREEAARERLDAERARADAECARDDAERARDEAERALREGREEADRAREEADRAREEADDARRDADRANRRADDARQEADRAQQNADQALADANQARADAAAAQQAAAQAAATQMSAAQQAASAVTGGMQQAGANLIPQAQNVTGVAASNPQPWPNQQLAERPEQKKAAAKTENNAPAAKKKAKPQWPLVVLLTGILAVTAALVKGFTGKKK